MAGHIDPPQSLHPDSLAPMLLRGAGASALAAAVLGLLLREWTDAGDAYRYLLLLALTFGVAVLGLLSGRLIGDGKGARLLVTVALAAVPANFAVLGALVLAAQGGTLVVPGGVAVVPVGIAVTLLAAVALTGFTVLSRPVAARFTAAYMLSCAVLLLPTRELDLLALPTAGLATLALLVTAGARLRRRLPDTSGARAARALLFLPLALLLGRSFWFYSMEPLYLTVALLVVFAVLRSVSLMLGDGAARRGLELVAVPTAVAAGLAAATSLGAVLWAERPGLDAWVAPAGALLAAALLYELSTRACAGRLTYRAISAVLLTLTMLLNLLLLQGTGAALACVLVGLWLTVHAYLLRQRLMFGTGALLLLAALLQQTTQLADLFDWGGWSTLAGLGVTAILLGSVLERYGPRLRARMRGWRDELCRWED